MKKKQNVFDKLLGREAAADDYIELVDDAKIEALAAEVAADAAANGEAMKAAVAEAVVDATHVETAEEKWLRGVKKAKEGLAEFRLSPRSLEMLASACENVASNAGTGIEDTKVRAVVRERAALFAVANNSLTDVLKVVREKVALESVPGVVYSSCFAVQKALNFTTNLAYRKALDPKNGEGTPAHDHRDHAEPPVGLSPEHDEALNFGDTTEHVDTQECLHVEILRAYEDLHLYLQLLTEVHGWDIDSPMPFMYMQNLDGTFTPIWGAEQALDLMEVRSAQARIKRTERQLSNLSAALAGAADVLDRAGRKAA